MKAIRSILIAGVIAAVLVPALAFAGGQPEKSGGGNSGSSSSGTMSSGSATSNIGLSGAGASFPYPYYSKAFDAYNQQTGVKVNYQSIGSSGGVKNITDRVVDFGASDAYLTDDQLKSAPATMVEFPTVIGAIVVTYNLQGSPTLKLTGDVIAKIFLGQINTWNDPAITSINPGVNLPNADILVVHRSDGSGTTFNFTYYLAQVSKDWADKVGNANSVNWPVGLGGAQNSGVAQLVTSTPNSIGYVELAYADQNKLPYATVQNKSGNWIVPSLDSSSLAGNTAIPDDTRIRLGNTAAAQGYPITSFTWLVLYKEQSYNGRTMDQAKALVNLMWWLIHDGQQYAKPLEYSPLPDAAVKKAEAILKSVTYNGTPILQ